MERARKGRTEAWTARGKEGRKEASGGGIEREREGARERGKLQGRYALSTSRASSLKLVYPKQPILGITQEFCLVRAWVGG